MSVDVLVTDCDTKHGFAIARYLKKKGLNVILQYRNKTNPYFFSLQHKSRLVFNLGRPEHLENFLNYLAQIKPKVVIPVSNLTVKIFSDNRDRIGKITSMLLPDVDKLEIAQNKSNTFKYAEELGINCPRTLYDTLGEAGFNEELEKMSYPVVLKYVNYNEKGVFYCNSENVVRSLIKAYNKPHNTPPIIQEYIKGIGVGFYALYKDGKCLNYFMHKRLHEYPVTGGASSFAVSYFSEDLKITGLKILNSLKWNGVAMIEFKLTEDNQLYLIEINPKFWGSYELSEKCGISFAYDYYMTALRNEVPVREFKTDIGFRWIFSDVMYYRDRFLNKTSSKQKVKPKVKRVYNDLYFDEPFILIAKFFDMIIRLIFKKRNPHSIPLKYI